MCFSSCVSGINKKPEWEFRRHVLPVLSKAGCNTGACHGALAGEDAHIQERIREAMEAGVHVTACKACADQLDVTQTLEKMDVSAFKVLYLHIFLFLVFGLTITILML